MPKLAICRIYMCGEIALVLGVGRTFVEGDEHWTKRQLYTRENYLNCEYTYQPPNPDAEFSYSRWKSQEDADKAAAQMRQCAAKLSKFHGKEVYFENLGRSVPVTPSKHDFDLTKAEQVEVTLDELELLEKDLRAANWEAFDWETWGK